MSMFSLRFEFCSTKFFQVNLPEYEKPNEDDNNILSPCRSRRSMIRRSHFSSISEHTSPSSASASSSVEPNDSMSKCLGVSIFIFSRE